MTLELARLTMVVAFLIGATSASLGAKKTKTLCIYRALHETYYVCTDEPVAEAKKSCEAHAKSKHGEEIECSCTSDPEEIADRCDPPAPEP